MAETEEELLQLACADGTIGELRALAAGSDRRVHAVTTRAMIRVVLRLRGGLHGPAPAVVGVVPEAHLRGRAALLGRPRPRWLWEAGKRRSCQQSNASGEKVSFVSKPNAHAFKEYTSGLLHHRWEQVTFVGEVVNIALARTSRSSLSSSSSFESTNWHAWACHWDCRKTTRRTHAQVRVVGL